MMMESQSKISTVLIYAVVVLVGLFGISKISTTEKNPSMNFRASIQDSTTRLDFEIYNSYTKTSPIQYTPWQYLAEPFREATLAIREAFSEGDSNPDRYVWEIDGEKKTGSTVSHTFTSLGKKTIKVTDTETDKSFVTQVMVKYVRREIRTLTDEDRNEFLDALETIYRLPTEQGKKLYGEDFKGMDYFLKEHLLGAGQKDCDHWHDDAGIMTHHIGYTLEVEQSMQLVNPRVAMPYWDYTIDDYLYDSNLGDSVVWSDDWFGEMAPDNSLHIITKGRWKYLELPEAGDFSIVNPYGLLRTPWNVNPTKHVTRYNYVNGVEFTMGVGCSELYSAFKKTSLAELNEQLNGETHGPVHVRIGGEWDSKGALFATAEYFSGSLALLAKILWRAGYMRVPDSCEEGEICGASCPPEIYERQGKTAHDVLKDFGMFEYLEELSSLEYDEDLDQFHLKGEWNTEAEKEFFESFLQAMCDPGKVGEMYTSAAPADPSFWILHPAAERFLNLRRIIGDSYPDIYPFDETWGYQHKDHIASDNGWVCDWSVVEDEFDVPYCENNFDCSGHNADDVLEFEFIGELAGRTFTNQEYYNFMHPFTEELPYMYDNYDLDHCVEQEIDVLDDL